MNKKKIIALMLASLLVVNVGTNIAMAEVNTTSVAIEQQLTPIAEKQIPRGELSATATSFNSDSEAASKVLDGSTSTIWHTKYTDNISTKPESVTISLGKVRNVTQVQVVPRTEGSGNGIIKGYKIYAGNTEVAQGTWDSSNTAKSVYFEDPISTDSIRIEVVSSYGNPINKYASIAEVNVYELAELNKLASAENIQITNGANGDLNSQLQNVLLKEEGTAIIRFQSSNSGLQSLFSISNNTKANEHFHVYIYGGKVGYELRKQTGDVSKSSVDSVLNPGINTLAFKAEKNVGYSIYLNGKKILNVSATNANFLAALEDANTFNLGITDRPNGSTEYLFTGKIDFFELYDKPLGEKYITEITGETAAEELQLPEGAIKTDPINIFTPGDLGSNNFRIPSLLTTKAGTLIAGIDARIGGGHDSPNNIDTAVKRSTDNGKTWDEGQIVLNYPDRASGIDSSLLQDSTTDEIFLLVDAFPHDKGTFSAQRGSGFKDIEVNGATVRAMELTHTDGSKYYVLPTAEDSEMSNVVTSTGETTEYKVDVENNLYKNNDKIGNTFAETCELKAFPTCYLAITSSKDDGVTWSKPKIISGEFKKEWMTFLGTGPGRGIEIKNGTKKGRLVFPVYSLNKNQKQSSAVIYSDDHGKTWKMGESVNDDRVIDGRTIQGETFTGAYKEEMTEAQVVEMPNGELKMFMRNPSTSNPAVATSKDGGETWENTIEYETDLKEPYCQLSVINYDGLIDGKPAVIFANPDASSRSQGTVRIGLINNVGTEDNPEWDFEWKYKQLVKPGYYAYSCLTQLDNGNIGLFYEGTGTKEMSYMEMNLTYLKADLLAEAPKPKISSIQKLDSVEGYEPGDTFNLSVNFDQTVSLIGDRSLTLIINGKEVSSQLTKINGNSYKFTGTVPQDMSSGSHKITVKSKTDLEVINVNDKVLDLTQNITTESTLVVNSNVVEGVKLNLTGNKAIELNEIADFKLELSNIKETDDIYAVEANLTYDADKFQLEDEGITAVDSDKTRVQYKETEPGKVKIVIASLANPIVSGSEIVNIKLKAKAVANISNIAIAGTSSNGEGNFVEVADGNISVSIKEKVVINKAALNTEVTNAEKLTASEYTEATWKALTDALTAAKELQANTNATQEDVNAGVTTLQNAINGLKKIANKSVLDATITKGETSNEADYTEETWTALIASLEAAKVVKENENAIQENVNKAENDLNAAIETIVVDKPEESADEPEGVGEELTEQGDRTEDAVDEPIEQGDETEESGYETIKAGDETTEPGDKPTIPGTESSTNNEKVDQENKNDLPNTGGVSSISVGVLGTLLVLAGGFFARKKKNK